MNENELMKIMQEVGTLLYKKQVGLLTQLESVMLQLWLHQQPEFTRNAIREFLQPDHFRQCLDKMSAIDEKAAWEQVWRKIG